MRTCEAAAAIRTLLLLLRERRPQRTTCTHTHTIPRKNTRKAKPSFGRWDSVLTTRRLSLWSLMFVTDQTCGLMALREQQTQAKQRTQMVLQQARLIARGVYSCTYTLGRERGQDCPSQKGNGRAQVPTSVPCQRHSISAGVRRMRPLSAAGLARPPSISALLFLKCPRSKTTSPPWASLVHDLESQIRF